MSELDKLRANQKNVDFNRAIKEFSDSCNAYFENMREYIRTDTVPKPTEMLEPALDTIFVMNGVINCAQIDHDVLPMIVAGLEVFKDSLYNHLDEKDKEMVRATAETIIPGVTTIDTSAFIKEDT